MFIDVFVPASVNVKVLLKTRNQSGGAVRPLWNQGRFSSISRVCSNAVRHFFRQLGPGVLKLFRSWISTGNFCTRYGDVNGPKTVTGFDPAITECHFKHSVEVCDDLVLRCDVRHQDSPSIDTSKLGQSHGHASKFVNNRGRRLGRSATGSQFKLKSKFNPNPVETDIAGRPKTSAQVFQKGRSLSSDVLPQALAQSIELRFLPMASAPASPPTHPQPPLRLFLARVVDFTHHAAQIDGTSFAHELPC